MNTRFKSFLPRLGEKYFEHADVIWNLRNSLAHNALNVAAFLSQAEDGDFHHLEVDCGNIFIQTRIFTNDFITSFEKLINELEIDNELADRVEGRLEYAELSAPSWRKMDVKPTVPPRIKFVQSR